jgi:hypothetical protein
MKKLTMFFSLALVFVFLYGCSDSTTNSQQSSEVKDTKISISNDTLNIYFNVSGTTYTYTMLDSILFFSVSPRVAYNVTLSSGTGDIWLYTLDSSQFYGKHFTATSSGSDTLTFIPKKYIFKLNNFTGTGNIKVVKFATD